MAAPAGAGGVRNLGLAEGFHPHVEAFGAQVESRNGGHRAAQAVPGDPRAVRRRAAPTAAEAYGKDPDFFAFYRSMQAYETGIKADTRMLLAPDSDFFKYFNSPNGGNPPAGQTKR